MLIIDETGGRKDGDQTAHVGREYRGNRGKIENGEVGVSSVCADFGKYCPLAVEPYAPVLWFPHRRKGCWTVWAKAIRSPLYDSS